MRDSLELTVSLVTPLFMHGADARSHPELRAPSIRGQLRYWYRAALGETDLAKLRQREAAVFGSTEQASSLRTRVIPLDNWSQGVISARQLPRSLGLDYLDFSLRAAPPVDGFASGSFRLSLAPRQPERDLNPFAQALAAVWLLINLGGIGGRSRRGFGSLAISGARVQGQALRGLQGIQLPRLRPLVAPDQTLKVDLFTQLLRTGIATARTLLGGMDGGASLPPYSLLNPAHTRIVVLGGSRATWTNWEDVLGDIGERLAGFRRMMPRHERPVFGLPIVGQDNARRASPLHIKVVRLGPRSFAAVLTLLEAELREAGSAPAGSDDQFRPIHQLMDQLVEEFGGEAVVVQ